MVEIRNVITGHQIYTKKWEIEQSVTKRVNSTSPCSLGWIPVSDGQLTEQRGFPVLTSLIGVSGRLCANENLLPAASRRQGISAVIHFLCVFSFSISTAS